MTLLETVKKRENRRFPIEEEEEEHQHVEDNTTLFLIQQPSFTPN
jgi:hypothetical protein